MTSPLYADPELVAMMMQQELARRGRIHLDSAIEEARQDARWGAMRHHANGTGRTGDAHLAWAAREKCQANAPSEDNWRDILEEEVFEAFVETDPVKLRKELIQVLAVTTQWISDLDRTR